MASAQRLPNCSTFIESLPAGPFKDGYAKTRGILARAVCKRNKTIRNVVAA
jgi:hypothetical protein